MTAAEKGPLRNGASSSFAFSRRGAASSSTDFGEEGFSEWDAVSLQYLRSINAAGESVSGKVVGGGQSLYVTWRSPTQPSAFGKFGKHQRSFLEAATVTAWFEPENASPRTPSFQKAGGAAEESFAAAFDRSRVEPFSEAWRLVLSEGQQEEQLFLTKAADREAGLLPLFHLSTQRYLHVHPAYGMVGLVPPEMQQRRQFQAQLDRQETQDSAATGRGKNSQRGRCRRRTRLQRLRAAAEAPNSNSNSSNCCTDRSFAATPPSFLEMIPLADMLFQQSVQNVLESIAEPEGAEEGSGIYEASFNPRGVALVERELASRLTSAEDGVSESQTPAETARSLPFSPSAALEECTENSGFGEAAPQVELRLDDSSVETDEEGDSSKCGRESHCSSHQLDWLEEDQSIEFRSARCSPDASPVEGSSVKN